MIFRKLFSLFSVFCGFSACIVFFIMNNYPASVWGFMTGVLSSILLYIHSLRSKNLLAEYYTESALWSMGWLGYGAFAIGISCAVYNIIIFIGLQIPLMPVAGSNCITAIWCLITASKGITLFWYAREYSRIVEDSPSRTPLLRQRRPPRRFTTPRQPPQESSEANPGV